ncbi:MAG: alpha/beta fold hydrolase [Actinomycetes bacterium]
MDHFTRAGLTFPVVDSGDPDGEVIVLLPGFPQDATCYDRVLPSLHAAGARTLVPVQRGYAATARPRRRRDYRTAETTADVLALLDAAEAETAHVVGHDWGAAPAWALSAWHPERVASLTVLSSPHPSAMVWALTRSTQLLRSWYMIFFQLPGLPEVAARRGLPVTLLRSGLPEPLVEQYLGAMAEPGALTGALNWYRAIPCSGRPSVGRVRVPTTYVWGRHDFALGRVAAERTERWVTGDYRFVELDAGHWLPETAPVATADAILHRVRSSPSSRRG